MAKRKRQHTVQKRYLEQWKLRGKFFVYDLKNQEIHPSEPKSIFRENHIYNWDDFGDEGKFFIDEIITDIENAAFPIIAKVTNSPINMEERYSLSLYIALQMLRTPKMKGQLHELTLALSKNMLIDQLKDPAKREELLKAMPKENQKIIKQLSTDPETKVDELFSKKLIIKIKNIREIWLQTSLELLKDLTNTNFHATWYLLQAGKKTSFITSDNPVVTISCINNSKNPTNKDIHFTEVTFPLSPKFMLLIKRKGGEQINRMYRKTFSESQESVRELNCRTAMFADRFIVSHSDKLLLKIAKLAYADWKEIRHDKKVFDLRSKGFIPTRDKPKNKSIRLFDRFL